MANATDLINEVAQQLNDAESDYENIRWSRAELLEYANDAVMQVCLLRPGDFSSAQKIALQSGSRQTLPGNVIKFLQVTGTLINGQAVGSPSLSDGKASSIARNWFDDLSCKPRKSPYRVMAFNPDSVEPNVFFVEPPVPPGINAEAMIEAVNAPAPMADETETVPIKTWFHNAVMEWMLYRAYAKDMDSASSMVKFSTHRDHFYQMLGISNNVAKRIQKDRVNEQPN